MTALGVSLLLSRNWRVRRAGAPQGRPLVVGPLRSGPGGLLPYLFCNRLADTSALAYGVSSFERRLGYVEA